VSEEAAAAEEAAAVEATTEDKISDSDAVEGEETDRDGNSN
jgi:hypothetical protein